MAKGIKYTAEEKIEIIETINPYLQLGYSLKELVMLECHILQYRTGCQRMRSLVLK